MRTIPFILPILLLTACAARTGWTPTLDTYADPNPERISADLEECRHLAAQASGETPVQTAKGAAIGGLLGAAAGAAIGAAAGNAGTGAAVGAAPAASAAARTEAWKPNGNTAAPISIACAGAGTGSSTVERPA